METTIPTWVTIWGNWSAIIAAVGGLVTGAAAIYAVWRANKTIFANREDHRRANRVERLNRQLSQLYGKLHLLNQSGMRNWHFFVDKYGNDLPQLDRRFKRFFPFRVRADQPTSGFNPDAPDADQLAAYRVWLKTLFIHTNLAMLNVLLENGDLILGTVMPAMLIDFAEHTDSMRLLLQKLEGLEQQKLAGDIHGRLLDDWREYVGVAAYPLGFGSYLQASYEVLKAELERLLNTNELPYAEQTLLEQIAQTQAQLERDMRSIEHRERAKVGQHYQLVLD